jgi:hypothetical protein
MMDLLKRFEEDSLDDPFANPDNSDDEGGDDGDDLERRLAGLDLGEFSCVVRTSSLGIGVPKDQYRRKCLCGSNMGCADSRGARPFHSRCARPDI